MWFHFCFVLCSQPNSMNNILRIGFSVLIVAIATEAHFYRKPTIFTFSKLRKQTAQHDIELHNKKKIIYMFKRRIFALSCTIPPYFALTISDYQSGNNIFKKKHPLHNYCSVIIKEIISTFIITKYMITYVIRSQFSVIYSYLNSYNMFTDARTRANRWTTYRSPWRSVYWRAFIRLGVQRQSTSRKFGKSFLKVIFFYILFV